MGFLRMRMTTAWTITFKMINPFSQNNSCLQMNNAILEPYSRFLLYLILKYSIETKIFKTLLLEAKRG